MAELSHSQFITKLKKIKCLKELIQKALLLYALLVDGDTPVWAKSIAVGALVYLVNPFDVIPDLAPAAGYADDLLVLIAAIGQLNIQIKPHHRQQAEEMYASL